MAGQGTEVYKHSKKQIKKKYKYEVLLTHTHTQTVLHRYVCKYIVLTSIYSGQPNPTPNSPFYVPIQALSDLNITSNGFELTYPDTAEI